MSSSTNSRVRPKEREFPRRPTRLTRASARPISQMSGSSSSGSRPPTLGSPVKEGWMQKRGDINRAWRRRYFALYQVGHASNTHHIKPERRTSRELRRVCVSCRTRARFRAFYVTTAVERHASARSSEARPQRRGFSCSQERRSREPAREPTLFLLLRKFTLSACASHAVLPPRLWPCASSAKRLIGAACLQSLRWTARGSWRCERNRGHRGLPLSTLRSRNRTCPCVSRAMRRHEGPGVDATQSV